MSRKDTIIIALLINASLLALLFMLAINSGVEDIKDEFVFSKSIDTLPKTSPRPAFNPKNQIVSEVNDEVDNFLKELRTEEISPAEIIEEDGQVEKTRESSLGSFSSKPEEFESLHSGESNDYVEIIVKRGDALEKIARTNGVTIEAIKKVNNLSSTKLSVGQVLKIPIVKNRDKQISPQTSGTIPEKISRPVQPTNSAISDKEVKNQSNTAVQFYIIKSGDNPWKIAKQFNVKFEELLRLNGLDEERARNLKIGDKVRVR